MMPLLPASEGAFTFLSMLPFLQGDAAYLGVFAHSMLAVTILLVLALMARMALSAAPEGAAGLVPPADLKPRNIFELFTEGILNLMRGVMSDEDARRFFPLIAGLFAYIFVSNVLGLFPGFMPPTDQVNTNLPMGLIVFAVYNISGLMRHGVGYLKHFMGPVIWLAPLMVVLEVISHLVRPLSLSLRLYGNIFGDHMVLDIFLNELPKATSMILGYGIPVIFLALGLFVCLIQAFVFSLLSIIYIGLAVEDHH